MGGVRERLVVTPQEEAIQIFAEVVRDLTSRDRDLKLILRRCQHACQLLAWEDSGQWFQREQAGHPAGTVTPSYRKVRGRLIWRAKGSAYDRLNRAAEEVVYGQEPEDADEEDAILDVYAGIDFLLAASGSGYTEVTGETKEGWSRRWKRSIELERVKVFQAASFAVVLAEIERMTFEFASQSYALLRYGNVLTDFWMDYRTQVDAALHRLNLTAHLDAIQSGLQSDNPEAWRAAVLECRNLLNDVADHLWRDPRETYEHLPGGGRDGKLNVVQGKFANRLSAYVHQKGLRGTSGKFVRDETERLAVSIRSLIALQSQAHAPVRREDARSVALATYFILGELVTKTDMQPIERYGEPAAGLPGLEGQR
jgi:hypothetical protein